MRFKKRRKCLLTLMETDDISTFILNESYRSTCIPLQHLDTSTSSSLYYFFNLFNEKSSSRFKLCLV